MKAIVALAVIFLVGLDAACIARLRDATAALIPTVALIAGLQLLAALLIGMSLLVTARARAHVHSLAMLALALFLSFFLLYTVVNSAASV